MVRVRMAPRTRFGPGYSWAVVKADWPEIRLNFSRSGNTEVIRTSELEIHIQLAPFRVAFYDLAGRLISKDADQWGMAFDGEQVRCWKWMPPDEQYFGLGEKADLLNKRGHSYLMWNTVAFGWNATTDALYEDVPFFIGLRQGKTYGIFFDNPYRSSFDLGAEFRDLYSFGAEGGDLNYYFFCGPNPQRVVLRRRCADSLDQDARSWNRANGSRGAVTDVADNSERIA